jgi:beta-galactosidase/beta-glucuronidase
MLLLSAVLSPLAAPLADAALLPAEPEHVVSLNGTWRFKLEQPGNVKSPPDKLNVLPPITTPATFEPFHTPDYKEGAGWHDLAVPGNWEIPGYSPATYNQPDNASAFYRHWFEVPAAWQGRRVLVNFDGVQNGAEVFCNGQPVNVSESSWGKMNYHEGGWLPFQADLTGQVKFGAKNLLAVRVTKNTRSADLDSGDYFFLGGLHRAVTLFSVPKTHLDDLTIQTVLLPDGSAQVKVAVQLAGVAPGAARVSIRLGDAAAVEAALSSEGRAEVNCPVTKPKLWSAEHPNLYPLLVELKDATGQVIETVTRRVGIREVSIEDGIFCVNHVPVKLTGICRHEVFVTLGTAVNEELWRQDITLAKAANVNAIRTSHYPYGPGFYDLCDELGIYVMDELPYCWSPNNDQTLTPAYEQRARETVRRDKNHACVLLWTIGNEGQGGTNFQVVADLVKKLDDTRPRDVTCFPYDKYHTELSDSHYTMPSAMAKAAERARRDKHPHIYLECPNVWDIRFSANDGADAACWDIWEAVLRRCWDVVWAKDTIPGAFFWEWQDRAVADRCPVKLCHFDPATGISYFKIKGVVDGFRHPRPQYYHVKMIYSPVKVGNKLDTSEPGSLSFTVTNHYSFTDLSELALHWTLLKQGQRVATGTAHPSLAPRAAGPVRLDPGAETLAKADAIRLDFVHPDGRNIVSHQFALTEQPTVSGIASALPTGLTFPRFNLVANRTENDNAEWRRITRFHGSLSNIKTEPASSRDLYTRPLAELRSVEADVVLDNKPAEVLAHLRATCQNNQFAYHLGWTGNKSDIQELGWILTMSPRFDHFSWKRQALWSVYPDDHIGRPQGMALPDSASVHILNWSRPDAFDFNSTKYNCDWASLTDAQGRGLRVEFAPGQQQQCRGGFGGNGAYTLIVNKQTSPPQDISSREVPDLYLTLSSGDQVEGVFRLGSNAP